MDARTKAMWLNGGSAVAGAYVGYVMAPKEQKLLAALVGAAVSLWGRSLVMSLLTK